MKLTKNLTFSQIKNRRFLKKETRKMRGIILDLGCGDGEYSRILAENPRNHVIALDSNKHLCKKILQKHNLRTVNSDAHKLPFKNHSFDAVFCNTVLEHVKDPNRIIQEISRVLKPQGKLLISIPFLQEIHSDPDDYQRYTPQGLRNLLNKHSIHIIRQHCDYGALNTLEYLLLGSLVWRLRLPFRKNFPEGYLYVLYLFILFLITKISHFFFLPLQKRDRHFLTQVTMVSKKD